MRRTGRRDRSGARPPSVRLRVIQFSLTGPSSVTVTNPGMAEPSAPARLRTQLWGFAKVRHRGLAKNLARAWDDVCPGESLPGAAPALARAGAVCPVSE